MNPEPLPPIPIPPSQVWKDLRIQVLPVIVFGAAIFGVSVIWQNQLAAPTTAGQVETFQAQVTSPQPGKILLLNVSRFHWVKKGDLVATMLPTEPRNELATIQAELDIARARMDPASARQRAAVDFETLRLDILLEKAKLAASRVHLELERSELERAEVLFKQQLIPDTAINQHRNNVKRLETQIEATAKAIAEAEPSLERLSSMGTLDRAGGEIDATLIEIGKQHERLKAVEKTLGTISLEAPVDGMVSFIFRHAGEHVADGEPILVISSAKSERIISYVRQPFPIEPTVGMDVEIRTRSLRRQVSIGKVLNVGVQLEAITNALAMPLPGVLVDQGRPFSVSFPTDLKILPGELVDLVLKPAAR